ncbi:MAG: hypothetical protein AUJ49_12310 [Desulfovibrionaceae bacterium CG1_02_65_16]|nr:MAG: hypothetical protein AUJ49_12310 [Desulfovibrionaceae bacterium CG1_02_65_16]
MQNPAPRPEPMDKPGFLGTFALGLKVWAREMGRLMTRQAKLHEARQLEQRLREETALFAKLESTPGPERELSLRQIEMLKFEIARLTRERDESEPRPAGRR